MARRQRNAAALLLLGVGLAATAQATDLPLHLDPIRLRPFDDHASVAAAAAVDGGFYLAYGNESETNGLPLDGGGAPAYPNPMRFSTNYGWVNQTVVGAGRVAGEALLVWSEKPSGVSRVYAALQAHADWTHISRPIVDLGLGRVPAAAGLGDAGLAVWVVQSGVVGVRLDAASWPATPPPTTIGPEAGSSITLVAAAAAPEANVYAVVWRYSNYIHARVVDANGAPVSNLLGLWPAAATALSVSWNGAHFAIVWSTASSIDAMRLRADGTLLDPQPIHIDATSGRFAGSASRPGETLVAWVGTDAYPIYQVRGVRLAASGQVLDPGGFLIHEGSRPGGASAANQVTAVAADAGRYLVTWIENYPSCGGLIIDLQDLLAAVVTSGDPPVAGPARVVSGSAIQDGIAPAVTGDRFWTAWMSQTRADPELLAARRDAAGVLLDPAGLELGHESVCGAANRNHTYAPPVVAGNATTVLTTWRHVNTTDFWDICAVEYRVHNAAGVLAGGSSFDYFNTANLGGRPPAAASDGERFLVAFVSPDQPNDPMLRWAGIASGGGQVAGGFVNLGPGEEIVLDAASNGAGYLLAWSIPGDGADAYVGRFDGAFNFLDPAGIQLAAGPGDQAPVRLASDGARYLAVWDDAGALRAARIDASGTVLDPGGFLVANRGVSWPFDLDWDGEHYVVAWTRPDGGEQVVEVRRVAADGSSPDPQPLEVLRRPDLLNSCSVASRGDGLSLIALTTRRPTWDTGARGKSGHGVLYWNPAALAIELPPAPAAGRAVGVAPNPFRSTALILLGAVAGRPGEVRILDGAGRVVRVLPVPAGLAPAVRWDGRDARGERTRPGVYFFDATVAGGLRSSGKLVKLD